MTEKEILELEKDNYTTIHLHLVGIFWRAYQRSALGFCKEIRPYKMNVRSNKRQRTVVSFLGFPDSALQEILEVEGCTRVDDSHITLPMEYLSDEEVTEMLPAYNDLPEKARAVVIPAVAASEKKSLYSGLSGQIMAFPLHSSTLLECMEFIAGLQRQLSSDGFV